MHAVITLDSVSVRYGSISALEKISGVFNKGSLTAIAGPNGAGKSTLLKTIAGVIKPTAGQVDRGTLSPAKVAYLPQTTTINRDFPITALQLALTGFWPLYSETKGYSAADKEKARQALRDTGLSDLEDRPISKLSGGQFQRLLFARVSVQDASLILLDEPFAAVDAETTARLMRLILDWHHAEKTIICVLHDLLMIQKYFPESFVLAGKCLGHDHTHRLLEQKLLSFDLDMAEICPGCETEAHHHHD